MQRGPEFFINQLQRVPGIKEKTADNVRIICPFHNEKKPSCGINIKYGKVSGGKQIGLGTWYCFGCGKHGRWNDIAEKLGLESITGGKMVPGQVPQLDLKGARDNLYERDEEDAGEMSDYTFFELDKFQHNEWRGFSKHILEKLGAKLCYHDKTERFYIWFPVVVNKKRVGFFRALIRPVEGMTSYLNKKGTWVRKHGLFPFDIAIKMMEKKELKTIVLVEGQRDALRLLRAGIPAVCIMGSKNWSSDKVHLLELAGVERILLCMDGDEAGRKAAKEIYPTIKNRFDTKVVKLWNLAKKLGLDKVDPNDAPVVLVRKLRKQLV